MTILIFLLYKKLDCLFDRHSDGRYIHGCVCMAITSNWMRFFVYEYKTHLWTYICRMLCESTFFFEIE